MMIHTNDHHQQQMKMNITVPDGVGAGAVLEVKAPNGKLLHVTVPPGVQPGQSFQVDVPDSQPSPAPIQQQLPPIQQQMIMPLGAPNMPMMNQTFTNPMNVNPNSWKLTQGRRTIMYQGEQYIEKDPDCGNFFCQYFCPGRKSLSYVTKGGKEIEYYNECPDASTAVCLFWTFLFIVIFRNFFLAILGGLCMGGLALGISILVGSQWKASYKDGHQKHELGCK